MQEADRIETTRMLASLGSQNGVRAICNAIRNTGESRNANTQVGRKGDIGHDSKGDR